MNPVSMLSSVSSVLGSSGLAGTQSAPDYVTSASGGNTVGSGAMNVGGGNNNWMWLAAVVLIVFLVMRAR